MFVENDKKIENLEQRIEFLLESDINLITMSQDKLRHCLTDLMKENENQKRDIENKNKEISRLKEKLKKMSFKLVRLTKKIYGKTANQEENNDDNFNNRKQLDNFSSKFIFSNIIPKNLDFRINSLKVEYSSFKKIYLINNFFFLFNNYNLLILFLI